MNILFMGTPQIAATCLEAILHSEHQVCAVFTREDKPVGRKQVLTPPPVKVLAQQHGIPVFQPKTLKDEIVQAEIKKLSPDIIVVVAYGRILPKETLEMPKHGAINLHVSLLPKYRGAAPVQWAVLNGETQTGTTIMYIDEGLDTGDIIRQKLIDIDEDETAGELFEKVAEVGKEELLGALQDIQLGRATRTPQEDEKATKAPPLQKEMAHFTFEKEAQELHNLVRGMNPWPVAYFLHEGKRIKVLRTKIISNEASNAAGEILALNPFTVACENGAIELLEVIPEGSKQMTGAQWAAGRRLLIGTKL